VVASILTTSAFAADLPVKAMVAPVPALYDWSGIYGGIHEGYMWANVHEVQTPPGFVEDSTLRAGNIGFHTGVQKQFGGGPWGGWVLGFEASFQDPTNGNSSANLTPCVNPAFTCGLSRIRGDWTVGGRVGLAFNMAGGWPFGGDYLITVSGGYVEAEFKRVDFLLATQQFCVGGACLGGQHQGTYVGAGIEHVLFKSAWVDWISGIDYQHQFFRGQTDVEAGFFNHNIAADVDMIRLRTTLKFKAF